MTTNAVLTANAMREADRRTIEKFGVPGFTLMESAGRQVADAVEETWGPAHALRVVICCGKGNNGGDGLVVARTLFERGARVHVVSMAREESASGDTGRNIALLDRLHAEDTEGRIRIDAFDAQHPPDPPHCDVVVDAVLGTGIQSAPREPARSLIRWLNALDAPVVAIDVPSGVASDKGLVPGIAVKANVTVTMAALKAGLVLNEGIRYAGRVEVAEIGIPSFVLDAVSDSPGCGTLITDELVTSLLPVRMESANKFSVGSVTTVAGSAGLTGAAFLASSAAERTGAGYVVCACPIGVQPVLAGKFTTVMTMGLPETDAGTISPAAMGVVLERAARSNALLIGCGLGRDPETQSFVRDLLVEASTPVVLDADGLAALVDHEDHIADASDGQWILTPHWGEFRRLAGDPSLQPEDRAELAATFAARWNCVLVLKGIPSAVGLPDGRCFIGSAGGPALATAGTGDILAGLCAGFRAQGLSAADAAIAALHTGGVAADLYCDTYDAATMTATDQLRLLQDARAYLTRG